MRYPCHAVRAILIALLVAAAAAACGAQPGKPAAAAKSKPSAAAGDTPPIYPVGRPVTIRLAKAVVLNYDPESLNPRVNQHFPPFDRDSVKAVLRRAQLANWPAGINTAEKFAAHGELIAGYKAYELFQYSDIGKDDRIVLVWIPRSENRHMPADMVPATAEGMFMAVREWTIAKRVSGKKLRPAAPAVTKGLSKELPMDVEYLRGSIVHHPDDAALERAKAVLVGGGKFTEAEFLRMAARAGIDNFPPGLNTVSKVGNSEPYHAIGYVQGSFFLPFNGVGEWTQLVWVPMSDNPTLREDYKDGEDQFFFTAARRFKARPRTYTWPADAIAAMKAKHSRAIPETIPKDIISDAEPASYKALLDAGYTEAEAGRIMQLSSSEYLPEGLEYDFRQGRYDAIQQLKCYRIAEYAQGVGTARLYWIPKEENAGAPVDLQPMTEEGAFVSAFISRNKEDKSITSKVYANKPEWEFYPQLYGMYARGVTDEQIREMGSKAGASGAAGGTAGRGGVAASSGGNFSTADMSQFTQRGSQGVMILYYGSGGAASNAYVYELSGPALSNKAGVAGELAARIAAAEPFIGFEHLRASDCRSAEAYIKKKAGRGIWVHCAGSHSVR